MTVTHEPEAMTTDMEDMDDDGFIPPPAVHVENVSPDCPVCGRPLVKHKMMELIRCQEANDSDEDDVEPEDAPPETTTYVAPTRIQPIVASREERLERSARLQREEWQRATEPPILPPAAPPDPFQPHEEISVGLPPRVLPLLPDGGIDYVSLAAGMRTVLERERDEMVRRGGPIEKQNIDLKERLAEALEEAQRWRTKAQTVGMQKNSVQEQLDEQIRINRKLRNENRQKREGGNHTRIVELKDLLDVVRKAPGFTVHMGGNGHYQIKKDGVFVTDAASSGGSTKVNMATRVKLRKAGLDV